MTTPLGSSGDSSGIQNLNSVGQIGATSDTTSMHSTASTASTFNGSVADLQAQYPALAKVLQDYFANAIFYQVKSADERSEQRRKEQQANNS